MSKNDNKTSRLTSSAGQRAWKVQESVFRCFVQVLIRGILPIGVLLKKHSSSKMDSRKHWWLLILMLAFSPAASANSSWGPCSSTEDYQVTVKDVKINPDPVIRGGDATFEIPAVASETISGGTVTVQVYYLGVAVHTEQEDLCVRTSCPVLPGEFSLINSEGLPSFAPTGSYRLDMRIRNESGDLLTCLKVNFRISAPGWQLL